MSRLANVWHRMYREDGPASSSTEDQPTSSQHGRAGSTGSGSSSAGFFKKRFSFLTPQPKSRIEMPDSLRREEGLHDQSVPLLDFLDPSVLQIESEMCAASRDAVERWGHPALGKTLITKVRVIEEQGDPLSSSTGFIDDAAQVSMAMARSVQEMSIARPRSLSMQLSEHYFRAHAIGPDTHIPNGFYFTVGEFPEVTDKGGFPTLQELSLCKPFKDDPREVVVVDRSADAALARFEQSVLERVFASKGLDVLATAQVVAKLVAEHLGGADVEAGAIAKTYFQSSQQLKALRRSIIMPLGQLKVGLSRHRALLSKVIFAALGIPCRVVADHTGAGIEWEAHVSVEHQGQEFTIDLMGSPGAILSKPQTIYGANHYHNGQSHRQAQHDDTSPKPDQAASFTAAHETKATLAREHSQMLAGGPEGWPASSPTDNDAPISMSVLSAASTTHSAPPSARIEQAYGSVMLHSDGDTRGSTKDDDSRGLAQLQTAAYHTALTKSRSAHALAAIAQSGKPIRKDLLCQMADNSLPSASSDGNLGALVAASSAARGSRPSSRAHTSNTQATPQTASIEAQPQLLCNNTPNPFRTPAVDKSVQEPLLWPFNQPEVMLDSCSRARSGHLRHEDRLRPSKLSTSHRSSNSRQHNTLPRISPPKPPGMPQPVSHSPPRPSSPSHDNSLHHRLSSPFDIRLSGRSGTSIRTAGGSGEDVLLRKPSKLRRGAVAAEDFILSGGRRSISNSEAESMSRFESMWPMPSSAASTACSEELSGELSSLTRRVPEREGSGTFGHHSTAYPSPRLSSHSQQSNCADDQHSAVSASGMRLADLEPQIAAAHASPTASKHRVSPPSRAVLGSPFAAVLDDDDKWNGVVSCRTYSLRDLVHEAASPRAPSASEASTSAVGEVQTVLTGVNLPPGLTSPFGIDADRGGSPDSSARPLSDRVSERVSAFERIDEMARTFGKTDSELWERGLCPDNRAIASPPSFRVSRRAVDGTCVSADTDPSTAAPTTQLPVFGSAFGEASTDADMPSAQPFSLAFGGAPFPRVNTNHSSGLHSNVQFAEEPSSAVPSDRSAMRLFASAFDNDEDEGIAESTTVHSAFGIASGDDRHQSFPESGASTLGRRQSESSASYSSVRPTYMSGSSAFGDSDVTTQAASYAISVQSNAGSDVDSMPSTTPTLRCTDDIGRNTPGAAQRSSDSHPQTAATARSAAKGVAQENSASTMTLHVAPGHSPLALKAPIAAPPAQTLASAGSQIAHDNDPDSLDAAKQRRDTSQAAVQSQSTMSTSSNVSLSPLESCASVQDMERAFRMWINPADIRMQNEVIGRGSYGQVLLARFRTERCAVKEIICETPAEYRACMHELMLLQELQFDKVVRFFGAVKHEDGCLRMCMEYHPFGDLRKILHNPQHRARCRFPEAGMTLARRLKWAKDIVGALDLLHSRNVVHRDLKPGNILISLKNDAVLADFGLSRVRQASKSRLQASGPGTISYAAPEALLENTVSAASDMYSFGCVLWELLSLQEPWHELNGSTYGIMSKVISERAILDCNSIPADIVKQLPDVIQAILACFSYNPAQRPKAADVWEVLAEAIDNVMSS